MSYLQTHGPLLIENGYSIIPLKPGEKHPTLKNWTNLDSREEIDTWLAGPMQNWGVGILTRHNPAIDIDCEDPGVVRDLYTAVKGIIGDCRAYRIGRAPRVLLLCRTDEPFAKLRSRKYEDTLLSTTHQVEILCNGQQFAAYHKHPDTGRDYAWPGIQPAEVHSDELPLLTAEHAQQIIVAFEQIASELVLSGRWIEVSTSQSLTVAQTPETWLVNHKRATQMDVADIKAALELLSSEDYDRWLQVGMALHHQFNGEDDGYEIWDSWSQTNGGSYGGQADTRYRWEGFKSDTRASAVTIGSVFHWAEEARQAQSGQALGEIERVIAGCESFADLLGGDCIRRCRDWLDLYPLFRDRVVDLVKRRGRVLSGSPISVDTVRKALKTDKKKPVEDGQVMFPWTEGWVYAGETDKFFDTTRFITRTRLGFDAEFNRLLKGGEDGHVSATRTALEDAHIRMVEGVRYLPGAEPVFNLDGNVYANRYNPAAGAPVPEVLSKADMRVRQLFASHVQTLIPDAHDRQVFIDFLTFVVQNPGKRVNFALLLQGQEGDGKSYFAQLMGLILGPQNCTSINGSTMEEKYTSWAEGSMLTFVEEIKLHGHSGYETLNRFKTYITNDTVVVRHMHQKAYIAPNVTSYILLTNFRNALPLGEMDTRYYVIFSRWNSPQELKDWKEQNPKFFEDLFAATKAAPGSLRKWFLERDITPGFDAAQRAPDGGSKGKMAALARDDATEHIQDIMEIRGKDQLGKNELLLSSTWVLDNWGFDGAGGPKPGSNKLNSVFLRDGWQQVHFELETGKVSERLNIDQRKHRFWSRDMMKLEQVTGGLSSALVIPRLRGIYDINFADHENMQHLSRRKG